MAGILKLIDSYSITYNSEPLRTYDDKVYYTSHSFVRLFNNHEGSIGRIDFRDELALSSNFVDPVNGIVLHYNISRFNDIINILRYEKPMWIYIRTDTLRGGIGTGTEPAGEEEEGG